MENLKFLATGGAILAFQYIFYKKLTEKLNVTQDTILKAIEGKQMVIENSINEAQDDIDDIESVIMQNFQSIEDDFLCVRRFNDGSDVSNSMSGITAGMFDSDCKFVFIDDDMNIREALQLMLTEMSSCGVVVESRNDDKIVKGIVDIRDITLATVGSDLVPLGMKINDIVKRFVYVTPGARLSEIIGHFDQGLRYIAVYDRGSNSVQKVISQGSVLRHFYQHIAAVDIHESDSIWKKDIRALNLGSQSFVYKCRRDDTAATALRMILKNGITSLPIVDDAQTVVGVISLTDIKYLAFEELSQAQIVTCLHEHVETFVQNSRTFVASRYGVPFREVDMIVKCKRTDSLYTVLHTMMSEGVHHVYVLEDGQATGVISFIDIINVCY